MNFLERLKHRRVASALLLLLCCAVVLTGCPKQEVEPENNAQFLAESLRQQPPVGSLMLQPQTGKTTFSFVTQDQTVHPIAPGKSAIIPVHFTPVYEPVSSLQIALLFDPRVFEVVELIPGTGMTPFHQIVQADTGYINFAAGVDQKTYGKDLIAFSLRLQVRQSAPVGETAIKFIPDELSALLPDIRNTETAAIEDVPLQRFYIE